MSGINSKRSRGAALIAAAFGAAFIASSAVAGGGHGKDKIEIGEPFFTGSAILEKELEFGFKLDGFDKKREMEFSTGLKWLLTKDWQVGIEIPFGVIMPTNGGKNRHSLSDVEFMTKYVILRTTNDDFLLALAGEVAPPTGSLSKEIGGTGEWGVSLIATATVPLGNGLKLGLFGQVGYEQQIRLSKDAREEAEEMEIGARREKEFIFRAAVMLPLADGKIVPSFEVIGTRILDATDPSEQGTIIELGGGLWWSPFKGSGGTLETLTLGVSAKVPVTSRKESNYTVLFVVKYEFE